MNFLTRFLRPVGVFVFFIFAIWGIITSIYVRYLISEKLSYKLINFTNTFENRFYDYRLQSMMDPKLISKNILLVKIDDYSLQKIGIWPIPRTYHAKLIDKLRKFDAKVIAFDVFFPEKSPQYGGKSPDSILVNSIKKFQENGKDIFIGFTIVENTGHELPTVPIEIINHSVPERGELDAKLHQRKIDGYTFPIKELILSEVGLGNIHSEPDSDGVFRQYPVVSNVSLRFDGDESSSNFLLGSLALNAYRSFIQEDVKNKKIQEFNVSISNTESKISFGDKVLEIAPNGETKIRYIGTTEHFPTISLFDLINAKDDDQKVHQLIKGKMVFIGSTAIGAHDLRQTPLDSKTPGVYSHLNMANMLLNKYFYRPINDSVIYSLILLFVSMAIFLTTQRLNNPFLDATVIVLILLGYYFLDKYYFFPEGYELKLFYSFFCIISSYSWITFLNFYDSNKEKKQIRGTFARYVAPTVVDEMLKDPDKLHVGGTKMDITCLFSDVRDFTKISEGLSATELAHSLNIYMGAMTDIVFDTKGTLDKYIGDAIVALWGAPLSIGNHAQYAVEAAIKMINSLPSINEEFRKLGRPTFNVGIGLNSGECSVGNMGSSRIFSYTALGDNMNLGARLESLCKYYGAQILISDMTLDRLDLAQIKTRPLDKVVVKGKTQAVGIHEVLHAHHWLTKNSEAFEKYLNGYKLFLMKDFNAALEIFNELLKEQDSDKPSKRLRDLCKNFLEKPESVTADFEVTVMTEK